MEDQVCLCRARYNKVSDVVEMWVQFAIKITLGSTLPKLNGENKLSKGAGYFNSASQRKEG